jgi:hypothetical protein
MLYEFGHTTEFFGMHPTGMLRRINFQYMFLILLSIILAAIAVAISMIQRRISCGRLPDSGIAREDNAIAKGRQFNPMKLFLVVVLPDGKVVYPRVADQGPRSQGARNQEH